jgi:hypothetical protein
MSTRLDMYLEGFRTGDAAMILRALADDSVYDDPVGGRMDKAQFAAYLGELLGGGEGSSGATKDAEFETMCDVVREERDGEETAWGWFTTRTEEGAGLIKAGPDGVRLEKLAYYRRAEPG